MEQDDPDFSDLVGGYPTCPACGSRDVVRDALTTWDIEAREWLLKTMFDVYRCNGCGAEISPDWQMDKALRTSRIRTLNDALRQGHFDNASIMVTSGVQEHGFDFVQAAARQVAAFTAFGPENDPHGEHDFGAFDLGNEKLFWKIDYYDYTLKMHSPDAANPLVTHRVLTIMLANEY